MMGFKSQAQQSQLQVQRKNEELAMQKMQVGHWILGAKVVELLVRVNACVACAGLVVVV